MTISSHWRLPSSGMLKPDPLPAGGPAPVVGTRQRSGHAAVARAKRSGPPAASGFVPDESVATEY